MCVHLALNVRNKSCFKKQWGSVEKANCETCAGSVEDDRIFSLSFSLSSPGFYVYSPTFFMQEHLSVGRKAKSMFGRASTCSLKAFSPLLKRLCFIHTGYIFRLDYCIHLPITFFIFHPWVVCVEIFHSPTYFPSFSLTFSVVKPCVYTKASSISSIQEISAFNEFQHIPNACLRSVYYQMLP